MIIEKLNIVNCKYCKKLQKCNLRSMGPIKVNLKHYNKQSNKPINLIYWLKILFIEFNI